MSGHLVPKAIESLRSMAAKLVGQDDLTAEYGDFSRIDNQETVKRAKSLRDSMGAFTSALEEAVCWEIGAAAFPLVWHTHFESDGLLEGVRLPFPTMAIEYRFDSEVLGFGDTPDARDEAPDRVIMLTETFDERGFHIRSCYRATEVIDDGIVEWVVGPIKMGIRYSDLECISQWYQPQKEGQGYVIHYSQDEEDTGPILSASLPMYDLYFETSEDAIENIKEFVNDCADEMRVALGLLGILNCDNAPVEKIPAPAKLNKKRVSRGRVAIPAYRTLHISDHTTRGNKSGVCGTGTKRAHWRRGHIRNQPTARGYVKKWIKPTIVGGSTAPKPDVILT